LFKLDTIEGIKKISINFFKLISNLPLESLQLIRIPIILNNAMPLGTNLKHLTIENCNIQSISDLKNLVQLRLPYNQISVNGAMQLASALIENKTLTLLDLTGN